MLYLENSGFVFLYEFAKLAMEREQEETLWEKKSHCDLYVLHA